MLVDLVGSAYNITCYPAPNNTLKVSEKLFCADRIGNTEVQNHQSISRLYSFTRPLVLKNRDGSRDRSLRETLLL